MQGEIRQVVHGVAEQLLERIAKRLGGLNAPHSLFGKITVAQAYDNVAFKIAADDLLLSAGVEHPVPCLRSPRACSMQDGARKVKGACW